MPKYSIVVPFHNEEDSVTALYDQLKAVMEGVGDSFELVFVDDGSRDRTYRLLEEIAAVDSRVLVIKLRRNFGQTSALAVAECWNPAVVRATSSASRPQVVPSPASSLTR